MKPFLAALVLACAITTAHSQAPAPATPASPAEVRKVLEATKQANAKLLEQQAKTLQLLEEMEKTAQTLKTLGKRG